LHSSAVTLGTFVSDAAGNVKFDVRIPAHAVVGPHLLVLSGTSTGGGLRLVEDPVEVMASSASASGNSPSVGFELTLILALRGGALIAYFSLAFWHKRRRSPLRQA
jgi:hypothetical protein